MRQRKSKMFAEILNRLREGKQTKDDIMKIKERCTDDENCSREAPRLFIRMPWLMIIIKLLIKPQLEINTLDLCQKN